MTAIAHERASIALAHDYLTQRGGAERVVLAMARAFPEAAVHTSLYDPAATFPEFGAVDVRPMPINRSGLLRRQHRLALPFLSRAMSSAFIDADVVVASSSGWAHGIPVSGRKIVYCHAPARWLYQSERYIGPSDGTNGLRRHAVSAAIRTLGPHLREWDQRAAASADRYLVNSSVIKQTVKETYGIDAEVLAPPPIEFDEHVEAVPVARVDRAYLLCVARLLPYKNIDAVLRAAAVVAGIDVVVVGEGPDRGRLQAIVEATGRGVLLGSVSDSELRWLYENCAGIVAASYEDFGLVPLEAARFGKPTVALQQGGYLDTVVAGVTGVFFEEPEPEGIAQAIERLVVRSWDGQAIRCHADAFSESRFTARLRQIVSEEAGLS